MTGQGARDEERLAQTLFRTLYDAGVSFESSEVIPLLTATVRSAGYGPTTPAEARDDEREALIARFDALRDSGVCSPTTRGLLDDAERLLRKHPEPEITEETVRRGALAMCRMDWKISMGGATTLVKAALEAALRVPVGERTPRDG